MIYLLGGIRAREIKGGAEGRVPIVTLRTGKRRLGLKAASAATRECWVNSGT